MYCSLKKILHMFIEYKYRKVIGICVLPYLHKCQITDKIHRIIHNNRNTIEHQYMCIQHKSVSSTNIQSIGSVIFTYSYASPVDVACGIFDGLAEYGVKTGPHSLRLFLLNCLGAFHEVRFHVCVCNVVRKQWWNCCFGKI